MNQAVFQELLELQTKHNIKKLSSKRPRKKFEKILKKVLTKAEEFGIIDKHSSRGQKQNGISNVLLKKDFKKILKKISKKS